MRHRVSITGPIIELKLFFHRFCNRYHKIQIGMSNFLYDPVWETSDNHQYLLSLSCDNLYAPPLEALRQWSSDFPGLLFFSTHIRNDQSYFFWFSKGTRFTQKPLLSEPSPISISDSIINVLTLKNTDNPTINIDNFSCCLVPLFHPDLEPSYLSEIFQKLITSQSSIQIKTYLILDWLSFSPCLLHFSRSFYTENLSFLLKNITPDLNLSIRHHFFKSDFESFQFFIQLTEMLKIDLSSLFPSEILPTLSVLNWERLTYLPQIWTSEFESVAINHIPSSNILKSFLEKRIFSTSLFSIHNAESSDDDGVRRL